MFITESEIMNLHQDRFPSAIISVIAAGAMTFTVNIGQGRDFWFCCFPGVCQQAWFYTCSCAENQPHPFLFFDETFLNKPKGHTKCAGGCLNLGGLFLGTAVSYRD